MKKTITNLVLAVCCSFFMMNAFAQVPTSGLIAYYPFNGDLVDYVGGRNGTSVGTEMYATDRWGNANYCYNVVNHTNYISIPTYTWVSGDYSVSSWIYINAICSYPRIYDFSNGYCINNALAKMGNASNSCPTMEYYINSASNGSYMITSNTLAVSTWYNIVNVQKGTTMYVYINSVLVDSLTNTIPPENITRTKNKIGGSNAPANDDTKAYFDDFRIYNRALTATEVIQLYNESDNTGISQVSNKSNTRIYPNPSKGSFKIEIGTEIEKGELQIMNSIGQQVLKQNVTKGINIINTNGLTQGSYNYILFQDKNKIDSGKLILE